MALKLAGLGKIRAIRVIHGNQFSMKHEKVTLNFKEARRDWKRGVAGPGEGPRGTTDYRFHG